MKTKIVTLTAFVVAFAGLTFPAFGRLTQTVQASIPFPFVVQKTQLPAGNYTFEEDHGNPAVLQIRSRDNATSMLVLTESAQMLKFPNQTNLIFDKIDGKYFLSQIWTAGNDLGQQILEAKAEQRWEREYAAGHSNTKHPTQHVTIPSTQ
jgi:hypothetical protein